jgi:hypothetical protein
MTSRTGEPYSKSEWMLVHLSDQDSLIPTILPIRFVLAEEFEVKIYANQKNFVR